MNSLSAAELKRRGMAAIEEGLRHGPVQLTKHNKPAAVVLSAQDYERLSSRNGPDQPGMSAIQWLLEQQPVKGARSKRQLDRMLREERESWQ